MYRAELRNMKSLKITTNMTKKNIPIGHIGSDGIRYYKAVEPETQINLCKGCCFREKMYDDYTCKNDDQFVCDNPNRIFKEVESVEKIEKKVEKFYLVITAIVFVSYLIYCLIEKIVF